MQRFDEFGTSAGARPRHRSRTLRLLIFALLTSGLAFVYVAVWSEYSAGAGRYVHVAVERLPGIPGLGGGDGTPYASGHGKGNGKGGWTAGTGKHPIDHLIQTARASYTATLKKEAVDINDAAAKYRQRRGRHPPPGFDAWYAYATQHGALVVEDFFDQIYVDLEPFRGIDPPTLRLQAHAFSPRISVREGTVAIETKNAHPKLDIWADMLRSLAKERHVSIPDVDVPINTNDELALVVPWEVLDSSAEFAQRLMPAAADMTSEFTGLQDVEDPGLNFTVDPMWLGPHLPKIPGQLGPTPERSYWGLVQAACAPRSAARVGDLMSDIWHKHGHAVEEHRAVNLLPMGLLNASGEVGGFAGSWTNVTDVCQMPWLQGLHGAFVRPEDIRASQKLFPIFSGGGKMGVNSDILLPCASEWNASISSLGEQEQENRNKLSWDEKETNIFWRGPATGGKNSDKNWQRFHRHRFVSMLTASHVAYAEKFASPDHVESIRGVDDSGTFRLSGENPYQVAAQEDGRLAKWVGANADVAFTDLHCEVLSENDACPYNSRYFALEEEVGEEVWEKHKYTSVLDGNGGDDGGELVWRLKSGSAVLRSSVYRKWYDARLWPWVHYVPVDTTFMDLYGVMEYFLGPETMANASSPGSGIDTPDRVPDRVQARSPPAGHDAEGRRIAQAGKEATEKVLRREDMLIYVYRLLLEYARLVDNARERLGWVEDLVDKDGK